MWLLGHVIACPRFDLIRALDEMDSPSRKRLCCRSRVWQRRGAGACRGKTHSTAMFIWRAPAPEARPPHPYYPIGVALSSPFVANDRSVSSLVQAFAAAVLALLVLTFVVAKRVRPGIVLSDLGLVLWFILSEYLPSLSVMYFSVELREGERNKPDITSSLSS
jgi:hypothetical protein